jgi:UDP-sulfoquinovose synthase
MWDLKVTDLMQGPVYGIETNESIIDDRLKTIFNYDELFGTVINRFVAQATIGYPLSVYGKGEQIRGYINIKDTLQCVHAAEKNTPKAGELNIYNQIMETFTVNQLAILIQEAAHNVGHDVRIEKVKNPRIEEEEHYYNPNYQGLTKLGVIPHYLTIDSAEQMIETVSKYRKHIDINAIRRDIHW